MRRITIVSIILLVVVTAIVSYYEKEDDMTVPQKLEKAMRLTRMYEYQDDDYDYVVRYPSFFEQTEDSLMDKGSCRFSFWLDSTEVVQTAFVEFNPDMLSVEQGIIKYSDELHATLQDKGRDYFILSGSLRTDTGQLSGRRFYAKFVQHRKLWFVQTLAYPEDCEQAVQRLIHEINDWKVWW